MNKTQAKTMDEILELRELLELKSRKLEYRRKLIELKEAKKNLTEPNARLVMDKVSMLKDLITLRVPDRESTIFPSEPVWKNCYSEAEISMFKKMIIKQIEKL